MPLLAPNNQPGQFYWQRSTSATWAGTDGGTWSGTDWSPMVRWGRSSTTRPAWLKDSSGEPWFKQPSSHWRYVRQYDFPDIRGVEYWPDGSVRGNYFENSSRRTGNHPSLFYMPQCFDNNGVSPYWDHNAVARAEVEALNKLADQKVNVANALAEARSTVDSIAQNAKTLAQLLLAAKHGKWSYLAKAFGIRNAKDVLKLPSNYYLQWKFGWDPLMDDISGLASAFREQIKSEEILLSASRTIKRDCSWSYMVGAPNGQHQLLSGSGNHSTKVHIWAKPDMNYFRQVGNKYGLDNPLGVVWEVTPWSFVVDWLVPVGNFLSALAAMQAFNFVGGYVGVRAEGESTILPPVASWPRVEPQSRVTVKAFGYTRSAYNAFPFPKPYYKSPFSTSHTTTALALLNQLFGKRG